MNKVKTFRWGGITHEWNKTAGEWQKQYSELFPNSRSPYEKCYLCGKAHDKEKPLYAGFFKVKPEEYQIKILCKECAYKVDENCAEPVEVQ